MSPKGCTRAIIHMPRRLPEFLSTLLALLKTLLCLRYAVKNNSVTFCSFWLYQFPFKEKNLKHAYQSVHSPIACIFWSKLASELLWPSCLDMCLGNTKGTHSPIPISFEPSTAAQQSCSCVRQRRLCCSQKLGIAKPPPQLRARCSGGRTTHKGWDLQA